MKHALGFLEVRGMVAGIECADTMLKAASVCLATQITTNPGLITLIVVGDIGSCRAAIDAGRLVAERLGVLVSERVIGRPEPDLALFVKTRPRWQAPGDQPGDNGGRNENGHSSVQARVEVCPEAPELLPIDVVHGAAELGSDPNSANTRQTEAQAAHELGSDPNSVDPSLDPLQALINYLAPIPSGKRLDQLTAAMNLPQKEVHALLNTALNQRRLKKIGSRYLIP